MRISAIEKNLSSTYLVLMGGYFFLFRQRGCDAVYKDTVLNWNCLFLRFCVHKSKCVKICI